MRSLLKWTILPVCLFFGLLSVGQGGVATANQKRPPIEGKWIEEWAANSGKAAGNNFVHLAKGAYEGARGAFSEISDH